MKQFITFIKATALGGLILLAPVVLVIIIVLKAIELLKKGVTPKFQPACPF